MKSFLHSPRPILTCMLKSTGMGELMEEIQRGICQGTDAFGLQIDKIPAWDRTAANFREIFSAMGEKPAYFTNYRRANVSEKVQSDEELAEELLLALDCGGTLVDVEGDLFCPHPEEITMDETAIRRQQQLIQSIHQMGGEVLVSSHVQKYIPRDRALEIAWAHQARGADISKIVTAANTPAELDENFEIILMLNRELPIPFLFLCNGDVCRKHRILGPALGGCLFLTTVNEAPPQNQPRLERARAILSLAGYENLPEAQA